jgi:hypothetical protein
MNASGAWSGTREELRELAASATGAAVIKTRRRRHGWMP